MLDTGLGLALAAGVSGPDAPDPLLVRSHAHYDHIGGNFEFERRLIHPAEAAIVAAPTQREHLRGPAAGDGGLLRPALGRLPGRDWVAEPAPATGLIGEGDVLDLGDRRLTVLHTPGHSWGSVCLWDEADGNLFCADTVYAGRTVRPPALLGRADLLCGRCAACASTRCVSPSPATAPMLDGGGSGPSLTPIWGQHAG